MMDYFTGTPTDTEILHGPIDEAFDDMTDDIGVLKHF
jgi:hypothetical protein